MSIKAMNWAREIRDVSITEKAVLFVLADRANCDGCSWPSVATIASDVCSSERTVQRALSHLAAKGLISRAAKGGRAHTTRYTLAISDVERVPATAETVADLAPFREAKRVTTSTQMVTSASERVSRMSPEPTRTIKKSPEGSSGAGGSPSVGGVGVRAARGTRLPADWQPDFDDRAFAERHGLNVESVAEAFRDYWHDKPGGAGVRVTWHGTWRNWCRKEAEEGRGRQRSSGQRCPDPRKGDRLSWLGRSIFDPVPGENDGASGPIIDMVVGE